jgi:hypothetical protein
MATIVLNGKIIIIIIIIIITNNNAVRRSAKSGGAPPRICIGDLPASLFPRGATAFVNDLEGSCHGIASLSSLGTFKSRFTPLFAAENSEVGGRGSWCPCVHKDGGRKRT